MPETVLQGYTPTWSSELAVSEEGFNYISDQQGITRGVWEKLIKTKEQYEFILEMVIKTIDHLKEGSYSKFDAQTTSNCCHGLSLFSQDLISTSLSYNLEIVKDDIKKLLSKDIFTTDFQLLLKKIGNIPSVFVDLTSLFILSFVVKIDPLKGRLTDRNKLNRRFNLSNKFCVKIVKELQKKLSNFVAESYYQLALDHYDKEWLNQTTVGMWANYLEPSELRVDKRGIKYAPCLYSMQVLLAELAYTDRILAIVSDLVDSNTLEIRDRYICLLKGNQGGKLIPLSDEELQGIDNSSPLVIFGGYTIGSAQNLNMVKFRIQPWTHQFPSLVLACDLHYPQFPSVNDDPSFDSTKIFPDKSNIARLFEELQIIPGFSAKDPSLFCLSHIFVSSLSEVNSAKQYRSADDFPPCFLPCEALDFKH